MLKINKLFSSLSIFFLILYCSPNSIPVDQLATDGEMVWCVSNADYVKAGSTLVFTGWDSVIFNDSGLKFKDDEATTAKNLYKTLVAAVEYFEFPESESFMYSKSYYLEQIKSNWKPEKKNETAINYARDLINEWPEFKSNYEQYDLDVDKNRYITAYSICKLWYQANN